LKKRHSAATECFTTRVDSTGGFGQGGGWGRERGRARRPQRERVHRKGLDRVRLALESGKKTCTCKRLCKIGSGLAFSMEEDRGPKKVGKTARGERTSTLNRTT